MGSDFQIPELERTRRFWSAHGGSREHLSVLHAFCSNPTIAWSPEGLCLWYGLRLDRVREVVGEFERCGILRCVNRRSDMYVWNRAQDWAAPHDRETRAIVQERWVSEIDVDDRGGHPK